MRLSPKEYINDIMCHQHFNTAGRLCGKCLPNFYPQLYHSLLNFSLSLFTLSKVLNYPIKFFGTLYGIWNLDFFGY